MKLSQKNYKRVVVKIGASLIYDQKGRLDLANLNQIVEEVCILKKSGIEFILVSSGAIAIGMSILRFLNRPRELAYLQAAAAVGQNELMNIYRRLFKKAKVHCAQILLTWEDFHGRKRYLNAKNTLLTLLKLGAVPIINENDTVSTEEIKFGDNDRLSALVSTLADADLLIILSDVEGLLDRNNKLVRLVPEINAQLRGLASPTDKKTCVGGMITKIAAAGIAVDSGIPCLIASGRKKDVILSSVRDPASSGTLFLPKKGYLAARERWLVFGSKPKGKIIVDAGAKNALLNKKSLLCVGIMRLEGDFQNGDIVCVLDDKKEEFARGKVSLSSQQIEKAKGIRYEKEAIHCDNIVIL